MPVRDASFDAELQAELNKLPWFGVDPIKSKDVMELGMFLDAKKFNSVADYLATLLTCAAKLEAIRDARS